MKYRQYTGETEEKKTQHKKQPEGMEPRGQGFILEQLSNNKGY